MSKIILVAGATGKLGLKIVHALLNQGAEVRVVVRANSKLAQKEALEVLRVKIFFIEKWSVKELHEACVGVTCVVSALAGLRDVIIDAQKILLDAALQAGVPRFIPSDYSLDFTGFTHGENRNLDLRREFHTHLDSKPIAATSIFNGAFAELLTDEMPMIMFKQKLLLYWGNADHKLGFTTMDDTAAYTARVALDDSSPRYLRISGDQLSTREIKQVASEVTGNNFRLLKTGSKSFLGFIIKVARKMAPGEKELYPAWQGMQYMHNMIDPRSTIKHLDNARYPGLGWTKVREVLSAFVAERERSMHNNTHPVK